MCLLLAVAGFLINLDINYLSPPHISVRFTPSLVQTAFPMLGRTSEHPGDHGGIFGICAKVSWVSTGTAVRSREVEVW